MEQKASGAKGNEELRLIQKQFQGDLFRAERFRGRKEGRKVGGGKQKNPTGILLSPFSCLVFGLVTGGCMCLCMRMWSWADMKGIWIQLTSKIQTDIRIELMSEGVICIYGKLFGIWKR